MSEIEEGPSTNRATRQRVNDTIEERKRQQAADALFLCSRPEGRRFIAYLIDEVGLFREVFSEAPRRSAFDEGRKSVGHLLRRIAIATDPANWTAIEAQILARKIDPTNKPKEIQDE